MAKAIPLVRAISLIPSVRWLERQNQPVAELLSSAGLPVSSLSNPMRPVPLLKVGELLRLIAQEFGPDVACRIVAETDEIDLVQIGRVALGTGTPLEALTRISFALPYFCSHELLSVEDTGGDIVVRHAYGAQFDDEVLHLMSQYALAVLDRICQMSGALAPRIDASELPAHPACGVAHLDRWFGDGRVAAAEGRTLMAVLLRAVAIRRFPRYSRDRSAELARAELQPLHVADGFAGSVRTLLSAMLEFEDAMPTVDLVAEAAGLSSRTFQRRLKEENSSFTDLLDEVRQKRAERLVAEGKEPIARVARRLGYAHPTALNRSMMRWTGMNPSEFRKSSR